MLTSCIACSKQLVVDENEERDSSARRGTTTTNKEAAGKSLTSQIKDMALKFSGVYRQYKPCTGNYKKGQRPYTDFDTISEGVQYPYLRGGSSSSTPAWDFTNLNHDHSLVSDSRFKSVLGGDRAIDHLEGISNRSNDVVLQEDEEPKEWMAQVEPGVHITFLSLPQGGNDLKRIRFSRELFNKWQAQRWWGENYDRILELYNVQRFNRQALHTPPRSEDERDSSFSRTLSARESPITPPLNKEWTQRNYYRPSGGKGYYSSDTMERQGSQQYGAGPSCQGTTAKVEASSIDASRTTTSSRDEASISISNASDQDTEWVEQDEPGVYITIRQLSDGTRELRRVRFSRERFGEAHAKLWWEENRERIQAQYL